MLVPETPEAVLINVTAVDFKNKIIEIKIGVSPGDLGIILELNFVILHLGSWNFGKSPLGNNSPSILSSRFCGR